MEEICQTIQGILHITLGTDHTSSVAPLVVINMEKSKPYSYPQRR